MDLSDSSNFKDSSDSSEKNQPSKTDNLKRDLLNVIKNNASSIKESTININEDFRNKQISDSPEFLEKMKIRKAFAI